MRSIQFPPLALLVALVLLAGIYGCEISRDKIVEPLDPGSAGSAKDTTGSSIDTNAIGIELTVTPMQAAVLSGESEQFYATVLGTANTAVTWSVEGGGTISADGLYVAPAAFTGDTLRATVTAASNADGRARGTAAIMVTRKSPVDTSGGGGTAKICFERQVLPIFQSNCGIGGCHDVTTRKKGYQFTTYDGIVQGLGSDDGESEIIEKITETRPDHKRMPPSPRDPLTPEQIATIQAWIAEGALNTKCDENNGNGCDTTNVTYSGMVRPLLLNNCTGCHSGATPPRGVNLSSYTGVKSVAASGKLYGVISRAPGFTPMPFKGNKLPDCDIMKIKAWIDRGALND